VTKEEDKVSGSLETKKKLMEECCQSDLVCQQKDEPSYSNKAMREKVRFDVGAALSVTQQVNAACMIIQNSLANLAEAQLLCAKATWPETYVGHLCGVEVQNKKSLLLGPNNMGGGDRKTEGCSKGMLGEIGSLKGSPLYSGDVGGEMEDRSSESLYGSPQQAMGKVYTLSKTEETPCEKRCDNDGSPLECSGKRLLINHSQSPCGEGIKVNLMKEGRTEATGEEDAGVKEGPKSLEGIQRISDLRELGETSIQTRRISKGGQRTIQNGTRPLSRLSHCSKTEKDSDIIICNNRMRVDQNDSESDRLWGTGKSPGMECSSNEEAVIREMDCMEVRDNEVMLSSEEGAGVL